MSTLIILCSCLLVLVSTKQTRLKKLPNRPNIVMILADDLGYQDVGFRGSDILTPNLDRLAMNGVILENHYVMPQCSPTRASLLSGRHAIRTGFWHGNIKPGQEWGLDLNETTMPEMLKRNGYATHGIGKWHCGMHTWQHTPLHRGFDSFFGLYLGSQDYFDHNRMRKLDFRSDYRTADGMLVDEMRDDLTGSYSTDMFTERAVSVISSHNHSKPLFLYLSYTAPHSPFQARKPDLRQFSSHMATSSPYRTGGSSLRRRTYATMVSVMDRGVGEVMSALRQHKLRESTLLVFLSDNGAMFGGPGSNYPLRGGKQSLHEGGVRSVAVVNSPLLRTTGYVNKHLHHVTDWYVTFQALARDYPDQAEKPQLELDGINAWKSISQNKSSGRTEVLLNMMISDKISRRRNEVPQNLMLSDQTSSLGKTHAIFPNMINMKLSNDFIQTGKYDSRKFADPPNIHFSRFHYQHDEITQQLFDEHDDFFVIRSGKWKLFAGKYLTQSWSYKNGLRPPPVSNEGTSRGIRLFDLSTDQREVFNVAALYPRVVRQLMDRIPEYTRKMVRIGERGNSQAAGKRNGAWYPWVEVNPDTSPILL